MDTKTLGYALLMARLRNPSLKMGNDEMRALKKILGPKPKGKPCRA